jgi:hypothetical protein
MQAILYMISISLDRTYRYFVCFDTKLSLGYNSRSAYVMTPRPGLVVPLTVLFA